MIYIFQTPLDAAAKARGKSIPVIDATDLRDAVQEKVGPLEYDHTISHKPDGVYKITYEEVDGNIYEGVDDQGQAILTPTKIRKEVSHEKIGETEAIFAPDCVKLDGTPMTLADLPEGFEFGNGTQVGSPAKIGDDGYYIFSYCVFPSGTKLSEQDLAILNDLQNSLPRQMP